MSSLLLQDPKGTMITDRMGPNSQNNNLPKAITVLTKGVARDIISCILNEREMRHAGIK